MTVLILFRALFYIIILKSIRRKKYIVTFIVVARYPLPLMTFPTKYLDILGIPIDVCRIFRNTHNSLKLRNVKKK